MRILTNGECNCCGGTPESCCNCSDAQHFVLTGTGMVTVTGSVPTTSVSKATGNVSFDDFYSWDGSGADGVNIGATTTGTTTGGTGFTATLLGTGHFERRNSAFPSYSGDFTVGEPLLFAQCDPASPPTYPGDIQIVFSKYIGCAGFRVEQNNATFRDDYFFKAYKDGVEVTYSIPGSNVGLFVDATAPGANSAPFYGLNGCCGSSDGVFNKIVVGFAGDIASGPAIPFAISTLEVCACP